MQWTDIKITVPKAQAEDAEAIATGVSGGGIYIEDYSDLEEQVERIAHVDLIEQDLLDKDRTHVTVHLYLSPDENPAEVLDLLRGRLEGAELDYSLAADGVEQQDWETAWKAYYHALPIGQRLAIVPSWEEYPTDRIVILCLAALDELVKGGERVLDIGTGSGILAIAALKLGAAGAEGVDIDPMCVRTAGENAQLNGVDGKLKVLVGDLSDKATGKYDIITANIVANAILHLAPCVPALLAEGGTFIASGIIDAREEEVCAGLAAAGLKVAEVRRQGGWVAILCKSGV